MTYSTKQIWKKVTQKSRRIIRSARAMFTGRKDAITWNVKSFSFAYLREVQTNIFEVLLRVLIKQIGPNFHCLQKFLLRRAKYRIVDQTTTTQKIFFSIIIKMQENQHLALSEVNDTDNNKNRQTLRIISIVKKSLYLWPSFHHPEYFKLSSNLDTAEFFVVCLLSRIVTWFKKIIKSFFVRSSEYFLHFIESFIQFIGWYKHTYDYFTDD